MRQTGFAKLKRVLLAQLTQQNQQVREKLLQNSRISASPDLHVWEHLGEQYRTG